MSTQLRLLAGLADGGTRGSTPRPASATRGSRRARVGRSTAGGRRARWHGTWRLDTRARRVGQAGVAAARAELERAARDGSMQKAS